LTNLPGGGGGGETAGFGSPKEFGSTVTFKTYLIMGSTGIAHGFTHMIASGTMSSELGPIIALSSAVWGQRISIFWCTTIVSGNTPAIRINEDTGANYQYSHEGIEAALAYLEAFTGQGQWASNPPLGSSGRFCGRFNFQPYYNDYTDTVISSDYQTTEVGGDFVSARTQGFYNGASVMQKISIYISGGTQTGEWRLYASPNF
jgi:hypothetical protein